MRGVWCGALVLVLHARIEVLTQTGGEGVLCIVLANFIVWGIAIPRSLAEENYSITSKCKYRY